ncbi:YncE family protein [Streptomyces albidoflavus]
MKQRPDRGARWGRLLAVTVVGALALFGPGSATAGAAGATAEQPGATELPYAYHSDLETDARHQRLYISDRVTGSVLVTDFDGQVVRKLDGLPGAADLALSKDNRTLYVALADGDAVVALDTATYRQKARYPTGEGTGPAQLALTGGKLWFSHGENWESSIGSLDLGGSKPVVRLNLTPEGYWGGPPRLTASPAAPGKLVAGEQYMSNAGVTVYDVGSGTPKPLVAQDNPGDLGALTGLALTPDGKSLLATGGYPYHHLSLDLDSLKVDHIYPTVAYPTASAVSARGAVAAGVNNSWGEDVYLFRQGESEPYRVVDFDPGTGSYLRPNGLAWSPDGTRLFAVTGTDGPHLSLRVVTAADPR